MALNAMRKRAQTSSGAFDPTTLPGYLAAYSFKTGDGYMFQGTGGSGTAATATNDPIGSVNSLDGASTVRLVNGGGSDRPIVAGGVCKFDGSNDILYADAFAGGSMSSGFTIVMRWNLNAAATDSSGRLISITPSGGNDYDSTGYILLCKSGGNGSNLAEITGYQSGETTDIFNPSGGSIAFGTDLTMTLKHTYASPGRSSIGINGATSGTGYAIADTGAYSTAVNMYRIGFCGIRPGTANPVPATITRIIICSGSLTGTDLTNAETWVAA